MQVPRKKRNTGRDGGVPEGRDGGVPNEVPEVDPRSVRAAQILQPGETNKADETCDRLDKVIDKLRDWMKSAARNKERMLCSFLILVFCLYLFNFQNNTICDVAFFLVQLIEQFILAIGGCQLLCGMGRNCSLFA